MKPTDISGLRVLVVEDDPEILSIVEAVLHDLGIRYITSAVNGMRAWRYFEKYRDPFDLVICDWMMPEMDGVEVLRRVRKLYPDLPFLMLTAKSTGSDVMEAKKSGVTAYIAKPFTVDELQSKLRAMARRIVA